MIAMEAPTITSGSPEWHRPPPANPIGSLLLRNEKTPSGLPALDPLDMDKARRHMSREGEATHPSSAGSAALTSSAPPLASPAQSMHSGPPPPYYPSSANGSVPGLAAYLGSPQSRRASEDDHDSSQRLSLPSIHEVVGKDSPILYTGPPPATSIPAPISYSSTTISPTTPAPRSHPEPRLPGPPNPYAPPTLPPYSSSEHPTEWRTAPASAPPPTSHPEDSHRPQPIHTPGQPPPHSAYAASPTSPPSSTRYSPAFSSVTGPPPIYAQSTHQPPPPQHPPQFPPPGHHRSVPPPPAYSFPSPGPSIAGFAAANHQPLAPAQQPPSAPWRSDPSDGVHGEDPRVLASKRGGSLSGKNYGESVKRHLEAFDLEYSLNEIADVSGYTLEFTKRVGRLAHQAPHEGALSALPTLTEIDDLMRRQQTAVDAFKRIYDVVVQHQHALAEQQAKRQQQQQKQSDQPQAQPYPSMSKDAAKTPHLQHAPPPDYRDGETRALEKGEAMVAAQATGFTSADPKKRKGRSAAPGRCHSCNRAETPEWRRGPDGARTLCNACGLHYAKLTRKMGNKASVGSSNLRPKEPGSSP